MGADAIEPDTKDWTWVLDRPCEECGFTPQGIERTEIADLARSFVPRWQEVLARPDATVRPSPTVWSPLEYGCHVRDVFSVFAGRLRLMLEQDEPTFANWDQDETAVTERYREQDPSVVSEQLAVTGRDLADAFASVPDGAWERRGIRSNGSVFTVESIGAYFAHDVRHHLHDVRG